MNRPRTFLFLACLLWGLLFAGDAPSRKLHVRIEHTFERAERTDTLFVRLPLPVTEPTSQTILGLSFSPRPKRILKQQGRHVGEWHLPSGTSTRILRMDLQAELHINRPSSTEVLSPEERMNMLQASPLVETGDPDLQAWADSFALGETDDQTLRILLEAVTEALTYKGYTPEDQGASTALREGTGDCTEYADLFVAACRLKGLPARTRYCIKFPAVETPFHNVAQVFLEGRGWVTVDPIWADHAFSEKPLYPPNQYLFLSHTREDPLTHKQFSHISLRKSLGHLPSRVTTRVQIAEPSPDGTVHRSEYTFSEDWSEKD